MSDQGKVINLSDLIEIEFLQTIQDKFADIIGMSSVIVDNDSPITSVSNATEFCGAHIRGNKDENIQCRSYNVELGKIAADKGEPVVLKCRYGLVHYAVPIMAAGHYLGAMLGGQVFTEKPDENKFKEIADSLGVDQDDFLAALKKVPIVDEEKIKAGAQLLYLVANAISEIAYKNNELKSKNKREIVLKRITEKIRSSLDIEETLYFICEETAKLFDVQRSAIAVFPDMSNLENFEIRKEYLSNPNIASFTRINAFSKIGAIWGETLINNNTIYAIDNIEESDAPDFFRNSYRELGVKSIIGTAIKKGDQVWGTLVLAEYDEYRVWTEEEKTLLAYIADQVYIAIYQAELFSTTKKQAEREQILRNITATIRNSLDLKQVKRTFVSELGKTLNIDRTVFLEYDDKLNKFLPIDSDSEYLLSPDVKSMSDLNIEEYEFFYKAFKEGNEVVVQDYRRFLADNNLQGTSTERYIDKYDVKSGVGSPIFYSDRVFGRLIIHYTKEVVSIPQEEIEFIRTVANQAGIALHQAELYEKEKQAAETERVSRNIIEILRSSIDKVIIKKLFVKNIGKFFNAGRVLLSEYDSVEKKYLPADENSEYLSGYDKKSLVGFDWSKPEVSEFVQPLLERREFNIYCLDEYLEHNYKGQGFVDFFKNYDIKSSYNFPITYQHNLLGFFCIDFLDEVRRLSDDDISRIRSMCSQAGIALYHADLYAKGFECMTSRASDMQNLYHKIRKPTHEILDISTLLSQNDFEHAKEIMYLNKIINSCNYLLELTSLDETQ